MLQLIIEAIWLIIYWYYIEQAGSIEKGAGRRVITCLIAGLLLFSGKGLSALGDAVPELSNLSFWPLPVSWILITVLFLLYDLFFDEEAFRYQWWKIGLPGAVITLQTFFDTQAPVFHSIVMFLFFLLLAHKRDYLSWRNGISVLFFYLFMAILLLLQNNSYVANPDSQVVSMAITYVIIILDVLLLFLVESTLFAWQKGFEHQTESFQKEVLAQQYDEIKGIYLNMRGWRHDYHNHIQVLKAHLDRGKIEEADHYLDELEQDLNQVDTYIKSGNLMIDAILNGKLTMAKQKEIALNCKAKLPDKLTIEDVDLCVILGNLLDNAIEACEQIPASQRFIRIYLSVNGGQLYLSIQNAAKEELNFEEQNYITSKRGNHGLGMKRVKATIDKYEGYLRLANEPGIFAAEATLPL